MLDAPPREAEKISWLYVAIGVLIVYSTIPVARALREAVDAQIGRVAFLYLAVLMALLLVVAAFANLRKRAQPPAAYFWLSLVFALFGLYIYRLREIPEEAMHLAQYGVLGLLVYRALAQRMRDHGIYLAAAIIVGIIGIVDEYIQWAVPSRYFDTRDMIINFIAGLLAQAAIMLGLRPALIKGAPSAASYARSCYLAAAAAALLALGLQNTPARVAWYASQLPALDFLMDGKSMMAQYGYRYDEPDTGVFRSRFSADELRRLDRERGHEVAEILDRYLRGEGYRPFLDQYTVIRDAYVHEAGVHLYSREYHLDRAREGTANQAEHYLKACREHRILKKYFTNTNLLSKYRWDEATEAEVSAGADKSQAYESAVSKAIITRMNETQALLLSIALIAALILAGRHLSGSRRADAAP